MRIVAFLIFIFILPRSVDGQVNPCHRSTEGKDFWFGFMESRNFQDGHYVDITVTSTYTCNYEIFIGNSAKAYSTGKVMPNVPVRIAMDWHLVEAVNSEEIQNKAIHLVSDQPLNVYALNYCPNSADVALIFPTESLGKEYYAMCYTPHIQGDGVKTSGRNSEFLVVAAFDGTIIQITPSKVTDQLKPANKPFTITLEAGEVYQVQSQNVVGTEFTGQGDLTGSYITGNKPFAFFSGSLSTTIPGSGPTAFAWDHLYEQIPPLQTWGRKFITVPLKSRHEDTYRILASENNTSVRIGDKAPLVNIDKGQYYEFRLDYQEPSLIDSDKPILLAQYSNSFRVDSAFTSGNGDPFMVIVSPVNQTREKVPFVAYDSEVITDRYFVNIVVKNDAVGKINLDESPVEFQTLGTTGYSYAQVRIKKGNHLLETTEAGKGFIAYVYGFGGVESYGYGVGYNLDIVLQLGSNVNADQDKMLVRCDGAEPLLLNAGNSFDNYTWSTGENTPSIKIADNGWYKVEVSTNQGCNLKDSVQLLVSKPVVDLGPDKTICRPDVVLLDAGKDFTHYLWNYQDKTDQTITVNNTGKYKVDVINKFGCSTSDEINLSYVNRPKINFSALDTLICGQMNTALNVISDKGNLSALRLFDGQNFNDLNIKVQDYGTYNFKVKATDEFGCSSDSTLSIGFHKIPGVDFSIDSLKCYGYNLDVNYLGDAIVNNAKFTWYFGGELVKDGIGINSLIIPLGINKTKRELKLDVTEAGCFNSALRRDIKVIPNLSLKAEQPIGCVPFNAKFIATNTETVSYNWDFGDGSTSSGLLSTTTNTYRKDGYYNVKLKVITDKGCYNESREDSLIYVAPIPTAGFTSLQAECADSTEQKIYFLGNTDLHSRYLWNLKSLSGSEIIKDPLETSGPLIFKLTDHPQALIGLKVISQYGCASDSIIKLLKRKPLFSTYLSVKEGCAPLNTDLSGKIYDKYDHVDFRWDFGDNSTSKGENMSHTFLTAASQYFLSVLGKSTLTGCSTELINFDKITTYPKPQATFSLSSYYLYMDNPVLKLANTSKDATGFIWNFGDGSTSDQTDPQHIYQNIGMRSVLLEAYNELGCSDTLSKKIMIAYNQIFPPNAFSPNSPNPKDREFKLISAGISEEGYHLRIYSKWNDIVFEASNEARGWNGLLSDGRQAQSGVYLWILDFKDFLGVKHQQKGTVLLVR